MKEWVNCKSVCQKGKRWGVSIAIQMNKWGVKELSLLLLPHSENSDDS